MCQRGRASSMLGVVAPDHSFSCTGVNIYRKAGRLRLTPSFFFLHVAGATGPRRLSSKQICWWILIQQNRGWTFSLYEALLWIIARSDGLWGKKYSSNRFAFCKHAAFHFTQC